MTPEQITKIITDVVTPVRNKLTSFVNTVTARLSQIDEFNRTIRTETDEATRDRKSIWEHVKDVGESARRAHETIAKAAENIIAVDHRFDLFARDIADSTKRHDEHAPKTDLARLQDRLETLTKANEEQAAMIRELRNLAADIAAMRERQATYADDIRSMRDAAVRIENGAAATARAVEAYAAPISDMKVTHVEGRTMRLEFRSGGDIQLARFDIVGLPMYAGVWRSDTDYVGGDQVTCSGSMFHCNVEKTRAAPGRSDDWQLCVKRGRDGKILSGGAK